MCEVVSVGGANTWLDVSSLIQDGISAVCDITKGEFQGLRVSYTVSQPHKKRTFQIWGTSTDSLETHIVVGKDR